jgi:hypothetical protein
MKNRKRTIHKYAWPKCSINVHESARPRELHEWISANNRIEQK